MVQAVVRALALLEQLEAAPDEGQSLGELARATGLKSPTARNLLQTLEALGYVEQQGDTRRYSLGRRALELGSGRVVAARLTRAARAALTRLNQTLDETVLLAYFGDGLRETLLSVESAQDLRVGAAAGTDAHFYQTATGRLLLSLLRPSELAGMVARLGLPGGLWPEADGRQGLDHELYTIREAGVARYLAGGGLVVALAVPVPLTDSAVRAAVGVHLPRARFDAAREGDLLSAMREAAAAIAAAYERTTP